MLRAGAEQLSLEEERRAIEELCRTYWYPLYSFIRRKGHGVEAAEDLGPRRTDAIPSWLSDLAESVGGQQIRLRPGGEATPQLTAVSYTKSVEVLGRLRGLPGTNAWERLAGWLLSAPEARAGSPMLQGRARP